MRRIKIMKKKKEHELEFNPYCKDCGHCGFIECCGITNFLKKHVVGKTGCANEDSVLNDLITLLNTTLLDSMKQRYLRKCPKCKTDECSGWHEVYNKHKKPKRT